MWYAVGAATDSTPVDPKEVYDENYRVCPRENGRFYFVINLYDANGKRKIKWISTGLTVRGNKRKAESMLREVLLHYDETGEPPTGRGGAYEK